MNTSESNEIASGLSGDRRSTNKHHPDDAALRRMKFHQMKNISAESAQLNLSTSRDPRLSSSEHLAEIHRKLEHEVLPFVSSERQDLAGELLQELFSAILYLQPDVRVVEARDLGPLEELAQGGFSTVYVGRLDDESVVVKKFFKGEELAFEQELRMYGALKTKHAYVPLLHARGTMDGLPFLVLEHFTDDLRGYIEGRKSNDPSSASDLDPSVAWQIARDVALALNFLHHNNIAHRDLHAGNVVVRFNGLHFEGAKVIDFHTAATPVSLSNTRTRPLQLQAVLLAPEFWPLDAKNNSKWENHANFDWLAGDMYMFGLLVAYLSTGVDIKMSLDPSERTVPPSLEQRFLQPLPEKKNEPSDGYGLMAIFHKCTNPNPSQDPLVGRWPSRRIVREYFSKANPYDLPMYAYEFSCGLVRMTRIFMLDTTVNECDSPASYNVINVTIHATRGCEKGTFDIPPRRPPAHLREAMAAARANVVKLVEAKKIEDNPLPALKGCKLLRHGERETQGLEMEFDMTMYSYHRQVREVWIGLEDDERARVIKERLDKAADKAVDPEWSTSFGLHIAVVTADAEPVFVFSERSTRVAQSRGNYVCGAVESVSPMDFVFSDDEESASNSTGWRAAALAQARARASAAGLHPEDDRVIGIGNMYETAARGLKEELGITVDESAWGSALKLTTVYLKLDTHEWGMCGLLDLSLMPAPQDRLTWVQVQDRFTGLTKDKFESRRLHGTPMKLPAMVSFIEKNLAQFASSTKLVVVKAMQLYFGVHPTMAMLSLPSVPSTAPTIKEEE